MHLKKRSEKKEKRHSHRKTVSFKAKLTSGGKNCNGFINNLSKDGMFMTTHPMMSAKSFVDGKILELKFKPFLGESLNLNCRIKWSCKTPPLGLTDCIGIEIIDPSPKYMEFLKTL